MSTGAVVWITGRPASGKSTFAARLKAQLASNDVPSVVLDSDELREALGTRDYSAAGRTQFYATLAALAALLGHQGLIVLVAATAHRRAYRDRARELSPRFIEVYVSTAVEVCARRDPKGLYERARADPHVELPGLTIAYEPPRSPDVVAEGGFDARAVEAAAQLLRPT